MAINEKHKLLLTFPISNVDEIKRRFSSTDHILFLYLGKDCFIRRDLDKRLGEQFTCIEIAKLLNEVANELRKEHVNWVDKLNILNGDNIFWWFGSVSAKNLYNSNLFIFSCYLELLGRLWNNENLRPQLVVVESIGLLKAICQWASKKDIDVEIIYLPSEKYNYLINIIISGLKLGYFYISLLNRCISAYISKIKYGRKQVKSNKIAIVNTYVLNSCLGNDGSFEDQYLPYLHDYLARMGYDVLIHPVMYGFHLDYLSIYRRMCQSKAHFIIPDDFLKVSDYLTTLNYILYAFSLNIKAPKFRDYDLSAILKEEQQQNLAEITSLLAALIYRLFLRLGHENLNVDLIISWYENQVNDKALICGARQAFPGAKIIGAQIFLHGPNWINEMPSQSEVDYKMVPHVLLETSEYQCIIARSFADNIPCQTAAALRYAHIFNALDKTGKVSLGNRRPAILVLLPYDMVESVEMLERIKDVAENLNKDVQIFIKCHHCFTSEQWMQEFDKRAWSPRYNIYAGSLREALSIATMVISSNTGSMVEAAARGIPVICLGRQTVLNQNFLEGVVTNLVTECFTKNELEVAVNRYLKPSPADQEAFYQEGKRIVRLFFTPVNDKTMLPFLGKN